MIKDEAVSPVIGVIVMVAITVILAAVIAMFVFGMSGNFESSSFYKYENVNITVIEKLWDGDSNHWGYITVSSGDAYHVRDTITQMKFQINHTYNVNLSLNANNFPVVEMINYEVFP